MLTRPRVEFGLEGVLAVASLASDYDTPPGARSRFGACVVRVTEAGMGYGRRATRYVSATSWSALALSRDPIVRAFVASRS